MTSQLILMNGFGVAIASDSTVTMGATNRTYDTAEKMFPIGGPHRVAVMHSGAVRLHELPYSLLVAEWASSLGDAPLRSIDQYRSSFVSWLKSNTQWFSPEVQASDFIYQLSDAFDLMRDSMLRAAGDARIETPESSVLAEVRSRRDRLVEFETFTAASDNWTERAWNNHAEAIKERFDYWFDDVVRSTEIDEMILDYAKHYLRRGQFINRSTLAFVGYGRDEIMPAYALLEVAGILDGELLLHLSDEQSYEPGRTNYFDLRTMGQASAIHLFLRGFESGTVNVARHAALEHIDRLHEQIRDEIEDEDLRLHVDRSFGSMREEVSEQIGEEIWEYSEEEFVKPLRVAIAALPTGDLAAVAKSLVELQALRQTTTATIGTVGGPIDVATISRNEGFAWIRHKSIDYKF